MNGTFDTDEKDKTLETGNASTWNFGSASTSQLCLASFTGPDLLGFLSAISYAIGKILCVSVL
jgi:hypothetical protein